MCCLKVILFSRNNVCFLLMCFANYISRGNIIGAWIKCFGNSKKCYTHTWHMKQDWGLEYHVWLHLGNKRTKFRGNSQHFYHFLFYHLYRGNGFVDISLYFCSVTSIVELYFNHFTQISTKICQQYVVCFFLFFPKLPVHLALDAIRGNCNARGDVAGKQMKYITQWQFCW